MSPDVKVAKNRRRHIERQIVLVLDQCMLEFPKEPEPPSFWKDLAGGFGASPVGVDIYTDGAWDKKTGTIKDVFHYGDGRQIVGSVGIVISLAGENWREFGISTITINEGSLLALTSVFPLELIGAVVAIKIAAAINCAPCRVHTDCQSVKNFLLRAMSSDP